MRRYMWIMAIWIIGTLLYAGSTTVIDTVMYQNQPFTKKDKHIFDTDWEGLRVWRWSKAQDYCRKLKINGYSDWRVASQEELQVILTKKPSQNGLLVRSDLSMPKTGGKYDDVWMWTRESKPSNLGAFVNFKKAKSGWADKKYKGYVICTRIITALSGKQKRAICKGKARQELTFGKDWVKAWSTCSGYTALKKDGSLWQFGKVGGCNWGQIIPVDSQTGKPIYEEKYIYHLHPEKIGNDFHGAKIINGGYRLYAIKKDGTLWGWGEGLGVKAKKLSPSHNWSDFGIKYEGNGCCSYDIGLKKNGTLWHFPETFSYAKNGSTPKLQRISKYSDWKKIVLGCCAIYGLRKDGSLWKSSFDEYVKGGKVVFKRYKAKKKSYDGDTELYPFLESKMAKVPSGTIYSPNFNQKTEANKDGTLCLLPEVKSD